MKPTAEEIKFQYNNLNAEEFIFWITDCYLESIGGTLTNDNMDMLTTPQHMLLAYRYILEEVMEGGYIQLIVNGYAGYVLESPFPMLVKKEWGMKDFSKHLYNVKKEMHAHMDELTKDYSDEDFMALYEQLEDLNEYGDDFLDDFQETTTPAIAKIVSEKAEDY